VFGEANLNPQVHRLHFDEGGFAKISALVHQIVADDVAYPRKVRAQNFYKKLSKELKKEVDAILARHQEFSGLTWHYEVFWSQSPVGMHNDRNFFADRKELCENGFIIPIEWSGKTPETRFYDLFIDTKVNWDGAGFSTLSKEKVPYEESKLNEFSTLPWEKNSIIFFDSCQIHDASDFRNNTEDYKLSINGLGYSYKEAAV